MTSMKVPRTTSSVNILISSSRFLIILDISIVLRGRKKSTVIQGLQEIYDFKKILKYWRKVIIRFCRLRSTANMNLWTKSLFWILTNFEWNFCWLYFRCILVSDQSTWIRRPERESLRFQEIIEKIFPISSMKRGSLSVKISEFTEPNWDNILDFVTQNFP